MDDSNMMQMFGAKCECDDPTCNGLCYVCTRFKGATHKLHMYDVCKDASNLMLKCHPVCYICMQLKLKRRCIKYQWFSEFCLNASHVGSCCGELSCIDECDRYHYWESSHSYDGFCGFDCPACSE